MASVTLRKDPESELFETLKEGLKHYGRTNWSMFVVLILQHGTLLRSLSNTRSPTEPMSKRSERLRVVEICLGSEISLEDLARRIHNNAGGALGKYFYTR